MGPSLGNNAAKVDRVLPEPAPSFREPTIFDWLSQSALIVLCYVACFLTLMLGAWLFDSVAGPSVEPMPTHTRMDQDCMDRARDAAEKHSVITGMDAGDANDWRSFCLGR